MIVRTYNNNVGMQKLHQWTHQDENVMLADCRPGLLITPNPGIMGCKRLRGGKDETPWSAHEEEKVINWYVPRYLTWILATYRGLFVSNDPKIK